MRPGSRRAHSLARTHALSLSTPTYPRLHAPVKQDGRRTGCGLEEALAAAGEGALILVRPGVHTVGSGRLLLKVNGITLGGDGVATDCIIRVSAHGGQGEASEPLPLGADGAADDSDGMARAPTPGASRGGTGAGSGASGASAAVGGGGGTPGPGQADPVESGPPAGEGGGREEVDDHVWSGGRAAVVCLAYGCRVMNLCVENLMPHPSCIGLLVQAGSATVCNVSVMCPAGAGLIVRPALELNLLASRVVDCGHAGGVRAERRSRLEVRGCHVLVCWTADH